MNGVVEHLPVLEADGSVGVFKNARFMNSRRSFPAARIFTMTMLPITYGYARVSKADDDAKNLETQLRLLAVSISKVIDPGIYTVIDPPWQRGTFPNIRLWSGS